MLRLIFLLFITSLINANWINELDVTASSGNYENIIDTLKFITDETIFKRDEDKNNTMDAIVVSVYNSGILRDTLYEIATHDDQINTLVNLTTNLLNGQTIDISNLNISLNVTALINAVIESGIVPSTSTYLLVNDTNNKILAEFSGNLLARNIGAAKLLNNLGNGQDLTVEMVANTLANTPNLNPKYNSSASSKQTILGLRDTLDLTLEVRDDNNNGSASAFLNNLISGVFQSSLVSTSLTSILDSVERTGISGPLIMDLMQNSTILGMFPPLVKGLYNNGVLNYDINAPFQQAKKSGILCDALQYLLTNPYWEPPIARLLHRMELGGYFKDVEDGLYGP